MLSDEFLARIAATPTTRWDASSPCAGWTARDVVAHVINGPRCILAVVNGKPPTVSGSPRQADLGRPRPPIAPCGRSRQRAGGRFASVRGAPA
ncbi:maleylpyruvate isomerase N-terminal domain-containing protein [Streptomyces sp. NBC_00846]|uniref:maleylpyruvate isomerase N-terminal domain-containing protein n=1 Tax=Streptomyces sp. NBC_00846 TaxID=2975849 RepID=UPI00386642B9